MDTIKIDSLVQAIQMLTSAGKSDGAKIFIPLLSVVLGSALTIASQFGINWLSRSREDHNEVRTLYSKCERLKYLIIRVCKNKNFFAVIAASYYRSYVIELNDNELSTRYLKMYDEKSEREFAVGEQLTQLLGEYAEIVSKVSEKSKERESIEASLAKVISFELPASKSFSEILAVADLESAEHEEISNLNALCQRLYSLINDINDQLKKIK